MLKNTLIIIGTMNSTVKTVSAGRIYHTEYFWALLISPTTSSNVRFLKCGAAGRAPGNAAS